MEVSSVAASLVRDLERSYASISAAEAAFVIDIIEQRIAEQARLTIIDALAEAEAGLIHAYPAGFTFETRTYDCLVGYRDILLPTIVGVVICDVDVSRKPVRQKIVIQGSGRYDGAELLIAPRLAKHMPEIGAITKALFEAGYAWLDEFIVAKTRELENEIAIALYKEVRLALAGRAVLADQVVLSVVQGEDGFYAFDQRAAANAVKAVREGIRGAKRDPTALFFHLLSTDLPFKTLFARHSLATGEPIHCHLRNADYLPGRSPFSVAERVLYRTEDMDNPVITLLPIEWRQQPYLFATFPTKLESEILPPLRQNLKVLQEAFAEQRNRVRTHVRKALLATGRKLSLGGVGELVAGFVKEFAKPG